MNENEIENIREFRANIEIISQNAKESFTREKVKVLHSTDKMTLLEIRNRKYNVANNLNQIIKTDFATDDLLSIIITFLFLALLILCYSQISLIFDIHIAFNITYIIVIVSLAFSSTVFFLGIRRFTVQYIQLILLQKEGEKELWISL